MYYYWFGIKKKFQRKLFFLSGTLPLSGPTTKKNYFFVASLTKCAFKVYSQSESATDPDPKGSFFCLSIE